MKLIEIKREEPESLLVAFSSKRVGNMVLFETNWRD